MAIHVANLTGTNQYNLRSIVSIRGVVDRVTVKFEVWDRTGTLMKQTSYSPPGITTFRELEWDTGVLPRPVAKACTEVVVAEKNYSIQRVCATMPRMLAF